MTQLQDAIAKLKQVSTNIVTEVREWAWVYWVRITGKRPTMVSKKAVKVNPFITMAEVTRLFTEHMNQKAHPTRVAHVLELFRDLDPVEDNLNEYFFPYEDIPRIKEILELKEKALEQYWQVRDMVWEEVLDDNEEKTQSYREVADWVIQLHMTGKATREQFRDLFYGFLSHRYYFGDLINA